MPSNPYDLQSQFRLDGKVAIVTGGSGVLCSEMSHALAAAGAEVVVIDYKKERGDRTANAICEEGGKAICVEANVLDKASLQAALEQVVNRYGRVDILINGAGGNQPGATVTPEQPFFDLNIEMVNKVFGLNFTGTMLACQVFGKQMAAQKSGVILNIASMTSLRPLTRVVAYSAAKAAVVNFTQWLAVYMAQQFGPEIRVNAMAPGFFLTRQNYYLLVDEKTGETTPRGRQILSHTPMNRYGEPKDLLGTMLWLVSPASAFVTGIVVPVDGGFSAYSGV